MRFPFEYIDRNIDEGHFGFFSWLDKSENELLQQLFPLPDLDTYPSQIVPTLQSFCQICVNILPAENIYYEHQQRKVFYLLDKMKSHIPVCSQSFIFKERSQLRLHLVNTPLYATLLLVDSSGKSSIEKYWWLTLLSRLYLHHNELRYDDSLKFDRSLQMDISFESITSILSQADLEFLTAFELTTHLQILADTHVDGFLFSTSFSRNIKLRKKSPLISTNIIESVLFDDDTQVKKVCHTDDDGEESATYLEFEIDRSLSLAQQRALFSKRKWGMANAVRKNNLFLPLSLAALTPQKLKLFLKEATPDLFSSIVLTEEQLSVRIIFWLEVWLGKSYSTFSSVKVFNSLASHSMKNEVGLHYNTSKTSNNTNTLFYKLPTQLVKGKAAPYITSFDKALYNDVTSSNLADISLPYPLQTYFFRLVEKIPSSSKRHNKSLLTMLNTTEFEYRHWLSKKIKIANMSSPQKITPSRLRNAFHHFSQSTLPKTDRAILQRSGVMGSFYVNSSPLRLTATLQNNWLQFLQHLSLNKDSLSVEESKYQPIKTLRTSHNTYGAALAIQEIKLNSMIREFAESFDLLIKENKSSNKMAVKTIMNPVIAYLYFRTAITCAIRPIKQPIPIFENIEPSLNLMLTQDKDAHRNKELRVLILDPTLSRLWQLIKNVKPESNYLHLYFSSNSNVKLNKLLKDFNIPLIPNSFRHTAASQLVMDNAKHYQQHHFNILMNHFDYGQSPLRPYSLISVMEVVTEQQNVLKNHARLFSIADKACLNLLSKFSNTTQESL